VLFPLDASPASRVIPPSPEPPPPAIFVPPPKAPRSEVPLRKAAGSSAFRPRAGPCRVEAFMRRETPRCFFSNPAAFTACSESPRWLSPYAHGLSIDGPCMMALIFTSRSWPSWPKPAPSSPLEACASSKESSAVLWQIPPLSLVGRSRSLFAADTVLSFFSPLR